MAICYIACIISLTIRREIMPDGDTVKRLPSVVVPEAFYELLRLCAFKRKVSLSEVVRQLLKESPALLELAKQEGIDIETLAVPAWGGSRDREE
jgi:hypothetical protein